MLPHYGPVRYHAHFSVLKPLKLVCFQISNKHNHSHHIVTRCQHKRCRDASLVWHVADFGQNLQSQLQYLQSSKNDFKYPVLYLFISIYFVQVARGCTSGQSKHTYSSHSPQKNIFEKFEFCLCTLKQQHLCKVCKHYIINTNVECHKICHDQMTVNANKAQKRMISNF